MAFGLAVVAFNLLGWSFDLQPLVRFPDAAMVPSTAISLALLFIGSAAVFALPPKTKTARICSLTAAVIAIVNIGLRLTADLDLDYLIPNRTAGDRMSGGTILCIMVSAATILALSSEKLRNFEFHLSGAIAGLQLIIAVFFLCRFVPGTPQAPLIFEAMSLYTAVCFLVLFIILFVAAVILPLLQPEDIDA
ncbi:hypothetical protein RPE78_09685 [Thioclava litoralis]|uniref:Uncharacterized protein n=1 Tax=Thioclava litoralis TaxID=3076557 RepID=A0ABZ1DWV7_9RHOB|nr:hypothetical protein RPE78_09685 [Thioclava sp. FTW29]